MNCGSTDVELCSDSLCLSGGSVCAVCVAWRARVCVPFCPVCCPVEECAGFAITPEQIADAAKLDRLDPERN